jgi:GWxTD domain-containing protein
MKRRQCGDMFFRPVRFFGLLLLPLFLATAGIAQEGDGPFFEAQLQTYRPDDTEKSGLKFLISVLRDDLLFRKNDNAFEAVFEVNIVMWDDESEDVVYDKSSKKRIYVPTFDETNLPHAYHDWSGTAELPPGNYRVETFVTDLSNDRLMKRGYNVTLQSYGTDELKLGQVVLLDDLGLDDKGEAQLVPHKSFNVSKGDTSVLAYAEIYAKETDSPLEIRYNIRENITENRLQIKQGGWTLHSHKRHDFIITDLLEFDLPIGAYRMILEVTEGEAKAVTTVDFTVELEGLPAGVNDVALAIDQLRYIGTKKELNMLKVESLSERLESFKAFWKRRDPTPLNDENEKMIEYYRRAAYVSRAFKVYRKGDGWKTDRGMVYMMYGPPNDVEHREMVGGADMYFNSQQQFTTAGIGMYSYEVWSYFGNKYDPMIEFVDETNSGEYRLMNYTQLNQYTGFRGAMFDGRGSDMLLPQGVKVDDDEDEKEQDEEESEEESGDES